MKKFSLLLLLSALLFVQAYAEEKPVAAKPAAAVAKKEVSTEEKEDNARLSEAFGNFIGKNLNSPGINFDLEHLITGIRKGAKGEPSPMSEEEYETALAAAQEKAFQEIAKDNLKKAETYMKEKSTDKNVVQLEPGKLQYEILTKGTGAAVVEHSVPQVHYTGRLIDGTVFGSSEGMPSPLSIPLDQTIPGFSKGLLGMKEGEKRRLYIHPEIAYGMSGQLPPNSLLIFDVEIVKANAKPAEETTDPASEENDLSCNECGGKGHASL